MKKTILIIAMAVLALGALGVGVVFAQDGNPPFGPGMMGSGFNPMHTYIVSALAEKLNLSVDEVNSQLASGKTIYQVAVENGITEDKVASFLTEVHTAAFDKAVADGAITRERADFMLQRMQFMWQNGYGVGTCPMQGQYAPNGQTSTSSFGPGMMRNWRGGGNSGPGMMGGSRWQNP